MAIRPDEITSVLKEQLAQYKTKLEVANVGSVLQVGDGIARIFGMAYCFDSGRTATSRSRHQLARPADRRQGTVPDC